MHNTTVMKRRALLKVQLEEKFCNDAPSPQKIVTTKTTDVCPLHEITTEHDVAGLSYIRSQEPSVLSLDNAFETVDEFLLDNTVLLSQQMHTGKKPAMKSSSASGSRGVQYLAKWADNKRLVGKAQIYDWTDNPEHERGELFNGRKTSFSERRANALNIGDQFDKTRHCSTHTSRTVVAANGDEDASYNLINAKLRSFPSSNPNTRLQSSEKLHGFEVKAKEELLSDNVSNSETSELQVQGQDTYGDIPGMHDIGPATQMAAEAMEALSFGSFANHEMTKEAHQPTDHFLGGDQTIERTSENILPEKVSSAFGLGGVTAQSRRRKMTINLSSRSCSSRRRSGSPRMKSFRDTIEGMKIENPELSFHLTSYPIDRNNHSRNPKHVEVEKTMDGTSCKDADKYCSSLVSRGLLDVEKLDGNKCKIISLKEVPVTCPKRRRTHKSTFRKPTTVRGFKISSLSANALSLESYLQEGNETIVKGLPEILDTVKKKKRSRRKFFPAQSNGVQFNTGKMSSLAAFHETDLTSKQDVDVILHSEGKVENSAPENPHDIKGQTSEMAHRTPLKEVNTISPLSMADDYPRASHNKGLVRPSVAREHIKLGANQATSRQALKNLRRRKDMKTIRVLFSQNLDDFIHKKQKKILARFRLQTASSIADATHFVTDKFARTRNMLIAMALGKPVVTHMWLESCGEANCFIDERNYILRDLKKEKEFGFSMPVSLAHAYQKPLLQGQRVFVTPNATPSQKVVLDLVKSSGGQTMEGTEISALTDEEVPEILIISCQEDFAICQPLLEKGANVFRSELLLSGIVMQKLEYERHGLFS